MPALDIAAFTAAIDEGAIPVDLRSPTHFAAAHVPCAVQLQFGWNDLGQRAHRFLPQNAAYVLIAETDGLGAEAEVMLGESGFRVRGYLRGGLKVWIDRGLSYRTTKTINVTQLQAKVAAGDQIHLLDVREEWEFDQGHIQGACLMPHSALWEKARELDPQEHWHIICSDGVRAGAAISMLERLGFRDCTLVLGGMDTWLDAGYAVTRAG
ncbi:MAG TPA: rhodanese-like domain-containing protein [Symbiobacteriaceae bacterium]|nr:rhodanese-like domain-containing protein [Symbiobacteriaceae bacterium]